MKQIFEDALIPNMESMLEGFTRARLSTTARVMKMPRREGRKALFHSSIGLMEMWIKRLM